MSIREGFNFLSNWVSEQGGEIVVVENIEIMPGAVVSPNNPDFGCDWNGFEIYVTRRAHDRMNDYDLGTLIHQMGHVFACETAPRNSEEILFIGWEYHFARLIGMSDDAWFKANFDYVIEEHAWDDPNPDPSKKHSLYFKELGQMSAANAYLTVSKYVALARENGLIVNNLPVAIRSRRTAQ